MAVLAAYGVVFATLQCLAAARFWQPLAQPPAPPKLDYFGLPESGIPMNASYRTRVQPQLLWRLEPSVLGLQHYADSAGLTRLLDHQFLLPLEQLRRGMTYRGSMARLRRLVHERLLPLHPDGSNPPVRTPLKIGVVGGSVCWGAGAADRNNDAWFHVLVNWMVGGGSMVDACPGCRIANAPQVDCNLPGDALDAPK